LLQAKSLVRKQQLAQKTDANELLKSMQDIADSFTKGSDASKTPDEVNSALGVASATLQTMLPLFEVQHQLAQREIEHAFAGVEACHNQHGREVRARLERAVAAEFSPKSSVNRHLQMQLKRNMRHVKDKEKIQQQARRAVRAMRHASHLLTRKFCVDL